MANLAPPRRVQTERMGYLCRGHIPRGLFEACAQPPRILERPWLQLVEQHVVRTGTIQRQRFLAHGRSLGRVPVATRES